MLNNGENLEGLSGADDSSDFSIDKIQELYWQKREQLAQSLERTEKTIDELKAYQDWRGQSESSPYKSFYQLFEGLSAIDGAHLSLEQEKQHKEQFVAQMSAKVSRMSPNVADFMMNLLAHILHEDYQPASVNQQLFSQKILQLSTPEQAKISNWQILTQANISFNKKNNRFNSVIRGFLQGLSDFDNAIEVEPKSDEPEKKPADQEPELTSPPPATDESQPGMDETERPKEGEPLSVIWMIKPPFGGYYKENSLDSWDEARKTWVQSEYEFTHWRAPQFDESAQLYEIFTLLMPNQWTRLPIPYVMQLAKAPASCKVMVDQNGDATVWHNGKSSEQISFYLIEKDNPSRSAKGEKTAQGKFNLSGLSNETRQKIKELKNSQDDEITQAEKLAYYCRSRLKYSNDSGFNEAYRAHPGGFVSAIDEHKQADCDVANTYFAGLLSELGISARHTVGHMVKGQKNGMTQITSGTGHAWTEVFNNQTNEWTRIDATPAGDSQMQEEQENQEPVPEGDYGNQEAEKMSDEELKQKLQKIMEELKEKQKEQKQKEDSPEARFAKEANCSPEEAKKVLDGINRIEREYATLINDMKKVWLEVIEKNRQKIRDSESPVTIDKGDELEDAGEFIHDIQTGSTNPSGFMRVAEQEIAEDVFGGFEVYLSADMSGSMAGIIEQSRDMVYLIAHSVMEAAKLFRYYSTPAHLNTSIKIMAVVFGGNSKIALPLTDKWGNKEKLELFRAIDGQAGGGTPDDQALEFIEQTINSSLQKSSEQESKYKTGIANDQLRDKWKIRRIILTSADGGSNSFERVKEINFRLSEQGIKSDLLLIGANEDDISEEPSEGWHYHKIIPVPTIQSLAEKALRHIVNRLKEMYYIKN